MSEKKNLSHINAELQKMLINGESLKNFYRITALNPHIELHDACQIFVERPTASVCFSFDEWNAVGRRIHKGGKGIKYFDMQGNKKYVFDEADTHGDSAYQQLITSTDKLLKGLNVLTGKEITAITNDDYQKILAGVSIYLAQNELLGADVYKNKMLCDGVAYSLFCKTNPPKDEGVKLKGLPYSLHENAKLFKEIYAVSNSINQEIEKAQAQQTEFITSTKEEINEEKPKNIVTVQSAVISNYLGHVALVKHLNPHEPYTEKEIYLGKTENYDNHGNYDNSDNSLVLISKNPKMYGFLYSEGWVESQQKMLENTLFSEKDYAEFNELQNGILKQFECIKKIKFDININVFNSGVPFEYPNWENKNTITEAPKPKEQKPTVTPYYQSYLTEQEKNPNAIMLIRLGDFYEAMGENAVAVSNICDLTLVGRDVGLPERVAMCGFPHHSFERYVEQMIKTHHVVAVEDNGEVWHFRSEKEIAEQKAFDDKIEESLTENSEDEQDFEEDFTQEEYAELTDEFAELLSEEEIISNDEQDFENEDKQDTEDNSNEGEQEDYYFGDDESDFEEEFDEAEEEKPKQPQEKETEKKSIRERKGKKQIQPSLFDLIDTPKELTPQEKLIEYMVKRGSGFENGKFRIYEQYFSDPTVKEFADFLRKEYGTGGYHSGEYDDWHDSKGVTFKFKDKEHPENEIVVKLNWTQVANGIADLIDGNNYFTEKEWLKYEQYKAEKEGKISTVEPLSDNKPQTFQTEKPIEVNTDLNELELDSSELGGAKARFRSNINAIHLVDKLFEQDRNPTTDEKKVLAKYVGWGGIQQAFDEHNESWQKEYSELKNLLSADDYDRAKGSVLNAHYTSKEIIEGIYQALDRFGVKGNNRILEPAMAIGNFYGYMPKEIAENAKLYGVELDNITGRIAQKLFPNVNVQVKGFEQTTFPNNHFDIVVSNVPFGKYSVYDSEYSKHNFYIHDYFIAKSIDKLKPNGIMAVITSKGTMDKLNPSVRKHIADRAELVGAIRLPNTAFKQTANTEVTTDILFFQKRPELINSNDQWISTSEYSVNTKDGALQDVKINSYFADHPEMMLGTLKQEHGLYGALDVTLYPDGRDLKEALSEAIKKLPENIYKNPEFIAESEQQQEIPVDYNLKPLCLKADNGKLYMRVGEVMEEQPIPSSPQNAYERIAAMIELRNDLRHVLDIQSKGCLDEVLSQEQVKLNQKYDSFVRNYGYVNSQTNTKLFRDDGDSALLFACENMSDDKKTATKADVFSKRTIRPYSQITHTDDCFEALQISKNEKGKVDIAFIEELTDKNYDTVLTELDGALFRNPLGYIEGDKYSGFETAEEYLSGEVVKKLKIANQFVQHEKIPEFERNIKALTEVQPTPIKAAEISARIGASWINKEYYHQFICELLKIPPYNADGVELFYNKHDSSWKVSRSDYLKWQTSMNAREVFGTERADAYRLFEEYLNLKATQIYDTVEEDGKPKRVLNHNETVAAREKQNKIKEAFKDWIFKDQNRRGELETKYNSLFNQIRLPSYDGNYLKFPQMNPAIELNKHQKDAIHRTITSGNTLLHHVVGADKTYTICATAMKLRQYGLAKKPMIIVPNHLVQQWANEFRTLYPTANLLIANKEDLEKENRKKFVSKVAMGDWDAVIIAQSSFNKIPISEQRQKDKIVDEINLIEETIESLRDEGIAPRGAVKNLERIKKNKEAFLKKLMDSDKKDNVLIFENLGVDHLFVDEAHQYKNLFLYTKMNNVAGISMAASQRASDLKLKCEYINELHKGDKGIVFATGTPISNSMTEMFTMQTYLQKRTLENLGITYFDGWAADFGETTTSLELAPSGRGYKAKTRFAKFTNLPELLTLYRSFADVKTADMIKLNVPEAERKIVTLKPSDTVLELSEQIAERAEKISGGGVDPSIDNMLKITSDGKKLALDPRCFDILVADESTSKLNECANNVFEVWQQSTEQRGAQLVFCDLSTPKKAYEDYEYGKDFDVYNDLKYKLVQKGIPEDEIAFIHEANSDLQKQALFNSVNDGKTRVLIGSTEKCGAGTNVQKRLVALHHLDTPYRPSDLEQREGRIIRQGNTNEKVQIFTYVTERTFDSYSYQILENKQRFIAQINRGDLTVREADDIDETTLTYAEIKAITAANPKIKRKMEIDTEVARLRILEGQFKKNLYNLEDKIRQELPEQIRKQTLYLERLKEDIATVKQNYSPDMLSINVLGTVYADKKEGGKALMDAFTANKTDKVVAEFCGFKLSLNPLVMLTEERSITIKGAGEYNLNISASASGTLTRLDNFFEDFPSREQRVTQKLLQLHQDLETAKEQVTKTFEHQELLLKLISEQTQINAELDLNKREEIIIDDSDNDEENESEAVDKHSKELPQNRKEVKTKRGALTQNFYKIYMNIAKDSPPDAYLFIKNGNRYEVIGPQAAQLASAHGLPLIQQELPQEKVPIVSLEVDQLDKYIAKLVEKGNQIKVIEPTAQKKEENIIETQNNITVLVRRSGQEPTVEVIENTLEAKQEIVGGYIEMPHNLQFSEGLQIVCNEEGKFVSDPEPNVHWGDADVICGDILFVGIGDEGETISLTPKQIDEAKKWIAENNASDFKGNADDLATSKVYVYDVEKEHLTTVGDMTAKQIKELQKSIKEDKLEETKQRIPLYKNNFVYAMDNGEKDAYLASSRENVVCRDEIMRALRDNFDGAYLAKDFEKPLVEKFGLERISFVLANTIQSKDWDGRFSRENKDWARGIVIYEDDTTRKSNFVVESHSVITDAFTSRMRQIIKDNEAIKAETETAGAKQETAEKPKRSWLKVNIAHEAIIKRYDDTSFMRMPPNSKYADYTYNLYNSRMTKSTQIYDLQSDSREPCYQAVIGEHESITLTNKKKETVTLTATEFKDIVGGKTSKDYEIKKQDDEKQWVAAYLPEEAMIGKYENVSLFQMPNKADTAGFTYYIPNNLVTKDEESEDKKIIVRLPEDFEVTAKNKETNETFKLNAFQFFEVTFDTQTSDYTDKNDSGNWNYIGVNPAAKIAEYEKATLFKMPKGEYENFVYYLPNKLYKENEENGALQFNLPDDIIIKVSNKKSGEDVNLSVEQFMSQIKDKAEADYNSTFQRPSDSKYLKREEDIVVNCPDIMKHRENWCIVRTKENAETGRLEKYLIDCNTGKHARSDDPATWTNFVSACNYAKKNGGETLAFCLDGKDKICCIDLDKCIDGNGNYSALAKDLINKSKDTYAERSISGKGVHIFGFTEGLDLRAFSKDGDLEFYQKGHFIAMTGDILDNTKALSNEGKGRGKPLLNLDTTEVKAVLESKCAKRTELKGMGQGVQGLSTMSDRDVVEKAISSKGGDTFKALYNGQNLQNNNSNSDMSLMNRLAFWCSGDKEQMLRIFATSGLFRKEKSPDYYEGTAIKAIRDTTSRYQPQAEKPKPQNKPSGNSGNGKV